MNRKSTAIGVVRLNCRAFIFLMLISAVKGRAQAASLIPGLKENHCSQILGTAESDLLACQVWDGNAERFSLPRQIEIYRQGRRLQVIETGSEILEWHFWKTGRQIAVHVAHPDAYMLFDTAAGTVVERYEKSAVSHLPEWAKSQSERSDEAVPQGPVYTEQRTQWIAKLLNQMNTIHPGMKRGDLQSLLKTEGGMFNRYQKTYVSIECPYIKLDLRFRAATKDADPADESPDDVIESISRPYLQWMIMD